MGHVEPFLRYASMWALQRLLLVLRCGVTPGPTPFRPSFTSSLSYLAPLRAQEDLRSLCDCIDKTFAWLLC